MATRAARGIVGGASEARHDRWQPRGSSVPRTLQGNPEEHQPPAPNKDNLTTETAAGRRRRLLPSRRQLHALGLGCLDRFRFLPMQDEAFSWTCMPSHWIVW